MDHPRLIHQGAAWLRRQGFLWCPFHQIVRVPATFVCRQRQSRMAGLARAHASYDHRTIGEAPLYGHFVDSRRFGTMVPAANRDDTRMTLPMSWNEWAEHDGVALAAQVKNGELTPGELAK